MPSTRVGLNACRVKPIGLPTEASASITVRNASLGRSLDLPQQQAALRAVSRNLFGKPERNEIDQELRVEYECICKKVFQRYCLFIKTNENNLEGNDDITTMTCPLPTLIAQELELAQQAAKIDTKKTTQLSETATDSKNCRASPTATPQPQCSHKNNPCSRSPGTVSYPLQMVKSMEDTEQKICLTEND